MLFLSLFISLSPPPCLSPYLLLIPLPPRNLFPPNYIYSLTLSSSTPPLSNPPYHSSIPLPPILPLTLRVTLPPSLILSLVLIPLPSQVSLSSRPYLPSYLVIIYSTLSSSLSPSLSPSLSTSLTIPSPPYPHLHPPPTQVSLSSRPFLLSINPLPLSYPLSSTLSLPLTLPLPLIILSPHRYPPIADSF